MPTPLHIIPVGHTSTVYVTVGQGSGGFSNVYGYSNHPGTYGTFGSVFGTVLITTVLGNTPTHYISATIHHIVWDSANNTFDLRVSSASEIHNTDDSPGNEKYANMQRVIVQRDDGTTQEFICTEANSGHADLNYSSYAWGPSSGGTSNDLWTTPGSILSVVIEYGGPGDELGPP